MAAAAAELLHSLASDGATTQKAVAAAPGVIEALVYLADQGGSGRRQSAQHQGAAKDARVKVDMEIGPLGEEDESDALARDEDYRRAALAGSVALLSLSAGSPSTEVGSMLSPKCCVCLNPESPQASPQAMEPRRGYATPV